MTYHQRPSSETSNGLNWKYGSYSVALAWGTVCKAKQEGLKMLRRFGGLSVIGAGVLALLGLPGLMVGIGLCKLEPWSRISAMVMVVFNLMRILLRTAESFHAFCGLPSDHCSKQFRRNGL